LKIYANILEREDAKSEISNDGTNENDNKQNIKRGKQVETDEESKESRLKT
jgi:hypothetical protein